MNGIRLMSRTEVVQSKMYSSMALAFLRQERSCLHARDQAKFDRIHDVDQRGQCGRYKPTRN